MPRISFSKSPPNERDDWASDDPALWSKESFDILLKGAYDIGDGQLGGIILRAEHRFRRTTHPAGRCEAGRSIGCYSRKLTLRPATLHGYASCF